MKNLHTNSYDPTNNCNSVINETFDYLKLSNKAEFDLDFDFAFSDFELFSEYESYSIGSVIRIESCGIKCYLTFTQVAYKLHSASKFPIPPTLEWQVWGIAYLNNNYGHVLIKPETFLDKIHEFINPQEIEFEEDVSFSKNYYVVSNDELKTRLKLTPSFRRCIEKIKLEEFIIEINDNTLVFGNKKKAQSETAFEFVKLFENVANEGL